VLAVFTNAKNEVLVAERADRTEAWQLPQGGIDPGETAEEALFREMAEEIGCRDFEILRRSETAVRYHFPEGLTTEIAKKFRGQDQIWFLARFPPGAGPDLEKATDREFKAVAWVSPAECLRRAVTFKKDAYREGFAALGLAFEPDKGER
jgi:putative (di)nucleoside polyphosphate hydrolase